MYPVPLQNWQPGDWQASPSIGQSVTRSSGKHRITIWRQHP
jgi:hypothetical protein